jgi:hypothetical protein
MKINMPGEPTKKATRGCGPAWPWSLAGFTDGDQPSMSPDQVV